MSAERGRRVLATVAGGMIILVVLPALAALTISGCASPRAASREAASQGTQADFLSALRRARAVHLAAQATLRIFDRDGKYSDQRIASVKGEPLAGYLEYWVSGERYRVNSWVDPAKLPGLVVQVAYDGEQFQVLLSDGTLSVSRKGDRTWALPVLPDPLLELLQVHYPLGDDNANTVLRFKDVQQREPRRVDFSALQWQRATVGDRLVERAVSPGAVYEGRPYEFAIYVPYGARRPIYRIERASDRRLLTRTEFAEWGPVMTDNGPVDLPHSVRLWAFNDSEETAIDIAFVITQLEVDAEPPPAVFALDPAQARQVWDDDAGRFIGLRAGSTRCSTQRDGQPSTGNTKAGGTGPASGPPKVRPPGAARSGEAESPMLRILQNWAAGRRDEAVAAVLELYDSESNGRAWRPYSISEQEFVALPADRREELKQEMVETTRHMRELARELGNRAVTARRSGHRAESERLMGALRRLAQANRGPEVTQLFDITGAAIEKLADRLEYEAAQSGPAEPEP